MTDGPTRFVTPDEFGVGTNFVGGCPKCKGTGLGWPKACRFCLGHGTALYVKQPDGTFKAKRVRRLPV